jgi:C_GCAxxG_C_C family probable redox protein
MSAHSDKAAHYFMQGYNCAQATVAPFAETLKVDLAQALRVAAGFGAGMGGLRQTCGAVSGMVLIAGLMEGSYPPNDTASKKALYDVIKKMQSEFVNCHGTTCCKELLKKAAIDPPLDPSQRTAEYYRARPCVRFVVTAAEIVERTLLTSREAP